MQYKILEESTRLDLVKTMKVYIDIGWNPMGGVSVVSVNSMMSLHFFQAIVREED